MTTRGRKAEYVKDRMGRVVAGLSCSNRRYYATHSKPRKWFGNDFDRAMILFRSWEAQQEGRMIQVTAPLPTMTPAHRKALAASAAQEAKDRGLAVKDGQYDFRNVEIPEDLFWSIFREKMKDPYLCAQKSGYPLDRLASLPAPQPPLQLSDALTNYQAKLKKPSEGEQAQVKWAWEAFSKAMGGDLQDVTKDKVTKWASDMLEEYSPKMVRNRVARVKTVLLWNLKNEHDKAGCERVTGWLKALELPNKKLSKPQPISKKHFAKLLENADEQWQAMLLVSLNGCFHSCDAIRLPQEALDLEACTLTFVREKENTPRVCCLWTRTVTALRSAMKGREGRKWVFETSRKGQWSSRAFQKQFRKLAVKAGLPDLAFDVIRDGAYSAAINAPGVSDKEAKLLAGHRLTGESDTYALRHTEGVRAACAAIEKHYFG